MMLFSQTQHGEYRLLGGGKAEQATGHDGLFIGTAYEIRTRVTGVRGQRPRPLDERGGWGRKRVSPPGM